ncbi:hypothetical protein AYL99_11514 [Fonsecaea erecta]|uniref:Uncharacterized protein n=1 Tax=Fonsecaea erecta TaxID=1367422 RepID=A0A178Z5G0_9EURO|nr:hypothetical protein AYL99_11514 [Fonsecaea erecta]OAP54413.1 hypothetical protein AYL99_11514 [Fonsecaea erecta]
MSGGVKASSLVTRSTKPPAPAPSDFARRPAKEETPNPPPILPAGSSKSRKEKDGRMTDVAVPSALVICRNKHWKYISSYHGPWLGFSTEIVESLAYSNYSGPRPQPIHPAVLFDLVKIRRLIDEATSLAVRAANGTSTSELQSSLSTSKGMFYGNDAEMLGLSTSKGVGHTKISRERRHRMRDQATQKLYQAYALDEVAASVAMMQSASALEDVAKLVLERQEHNPHAQYVHFFHEKIPCMGVAEHTSLDPLTDVIRQKPTEWSPYRTRAVTRMFMQDFEGVVRDCTDALAAYKLYHSQHERDQQDLVQPQDARTPGQEFHPKGGITDKDQPSSIESQLLFLRGTAYLTLSCRHVRQALHGLRKDHALQADEGMDPSPTDIKEDKQRAEARKLVRTYAKRALRDYLSYLSHFEYTPGLSPEYASQLLDQFTEKTTAGTGRRSRGENLFDGEAQQTVKSDTLVKYESMADGPKKIGRPQLPAPPIYKVNELFAAVPPANVPPYTPEREREISQNHPIFSLPDFAEAVNYSPLMLEVLHCLLLCHCLIQTSAKELQRHAYMVARVARVCDGYPVFLAPRSPARADWLKILARTDNWIGLAEPWRNLCTPVHLTQYLKRPSLKDGEETSEERKLRIKTTAQMQAFTDESILEEELRKTEHSARRRAPYEAEDTTRKNSQLNPSSSGCGRGSKDSSLKTPGGSRAEDKGASFPETTERVEAIVQWIREAPPPSASDGTGRHKKRPAAKGKLKKTASSASSVRETDLAGVERSVESLNLVD